MQRRSLRTVGSGLLLLLLTACPQVGGSLEVVVSGLPDGTTGLVIVAHEDGASFQAATTVTLSGLAPGSYTVTAETVRTDDPVVSALYDGSGVPATVEVRSGASASATVTYAQRPGSGALWTPHEDGVVATGYTADNLRSSGAQAPDVTLSGAPASREAVAFDRAGNLWASNVDDDVLEMYGAADLAADGAPTPSVVVEVPAGPLGIAFDPDGNLWVAGGSGDSVMRFGSDQLLASGAPTPEVVLSDSGGSLDAPLALAVDAAGNLWVTNRGDANSIVRFGPSQLQASGAPAPEATITDDGSGRLNRPIALAFDAAGSLWVASLELPSILRYDAPGSLVGAVSPSADADLTDASIDTVGGLAFDNSGDLWISTWPDGVLLKFADPASLSGVVTPGPEVTLTGTEAIDLGLLAFHPPPEGLPIGAP